MTPRELVIIATFVIPITALFVDVFRFDAAANGQPWPISARGLGWATFGCVTACWGGLFWWGSI